jgi:hypothetical protein
MKENPTPEEAIEYLENFYKDRTRNREILLDLIVDTPGVAKIASISHSQISRIRKREMDVSDDYLITKCSLIVESKKRCKANKK